MSRKLAAALFAAFTISFISLITVAAFADVSPVSDRDLVAAAAPALAAPVQAVLASTGNDWTGIADQVFNALALTLVGWLLRIVSPAALRFGDWVGQRAAVEDLVRDEKMAALAKFVGDQALSLALGRLGYTREDLKDLRIRNAVFDYAANFVREQWPEIWTWVDQNKNGQIDYFEATTAHTLPPVNLQATPAKGA